MNDRYVEAFSVYIFIQMCSLDINVCLSSLLPLPKVEKSSQKWLVGLDHVPLKQQPNCSGPIAPPGGQEGELSCWPFLSFFLLEN